MNISITCGQTLLSIRKQQTGDFVYSYHSGRYPAPSIDREFACSERFADEVYQLALTAINEIKQMDVGIYMEWGCAVLLDRNSIYAKMDHCYSKFDEHDYPKLSTEVNEKIGELIAGLCNRIDAMAGADRRNSVDEPVGESMETGIQSKKEATNEKKPSGKALKGLLERYFK
ncbi:MAG: hypothetical protein IIV14_06240 [Bacteroidaceae bacterium]|nr:hypothetical protein [Bacteroidaceae bacterium]